MKIINRSKQRCAEYQEQKRNRTDEQQEQACTTKELVIAYWNANGLWCTEKHESTLEAMKQANISIMMVDETHLRKGGNVDLSVFEGYSVYAMFGEDSARKLEAEN